MRRRNCSPIPQLSVMASRRRCRSRTAIARRGAIGSVHQRRASHLFRHACARCRRARSASGPILGLGAGNRGRTSGSHRSVHRAGCGRAGVARLFLARWDQQRRLGICRAGRRFFQSPGHCARRQIMAAGKPTKKRAIGYITGNNLAYTAGSANPTPRLWQRHGGRAEFEHRAGIRNMPRIAPGPRRANASSNGALPSPALSSTIGRPT